MKKIPPQIYSVYTSFIPRETIIGTNSPINFIVIGSYLRYLVCKMDKIVIANTCPADIEGNKDFIPILSVYISSQ